MVNAIPRWFQLVTLGVTPTVMVREIVDRVERPRANIAIVVLGSEKRLTDVPAIRNGRLAPWIWVDLTGVVFLESNPANTNTAIDPLPEDDGKRKRQYWSQEDRGTLLEYATKRVDTVLDRTIRTDTKTDFHDRAIVVMLVRTGARGAELFADPKDDKRNGIQWCDVDFDDRLIEVYGKSSEYEQAPFPKSVHDVLEDDARAYRGFHFIPLLLSNLEATSRPSSMLGSITTVEEVSSSRPAAERPFS